MDRITQIFIKNIRAIESMHLDLSTSLTTLIGENGAGKSTLVECFELLRKMAEPEFIQHFYHIHRGMPSLLRKGASSLELGVVIEDDEGKLPRLTYRVVLETRNIDVAIREESLQVSGGSEQKNPFYALLQDATQRRICNEKGEMLPFLENYPRTSLLLPGSAAYGSVRPEIRRLLKHLRGIEVHLGFDTRASWAARTYQRPESLRSGSLIYPAERLQLLGFNLANAWQELQSKEESHRTKTMSLVRLGLGERVDSVVLKPDPGGGNIYLSLRFNDLAEPILATDLSEGQLAWLAFVAMLRLNQHRSLLVIDEPESHLHPYLLSGVIEMLKSSGTPVVITTHSDSVLELLDHPADSVRVCTLDPKGRVLQQKLDAEKLEKWLAHYGDLARLRSEGYLSRSRTQPF